MVTHVCLTAAVYLASAALASADADVTHPQLAQGKASFVRREQARVADAAGHGSDVHVHHAAVASHGLTVDDSKHEEQLRRLESAFQPPPVPQGQPSQASNAPGLIGLVIGAGLNSKGGASVEPGSVSEIHQCADAMHTGRTAAGASSPESCQEMMFTSRHAKVNACWDRHDGPTLRRNCRRTCSCCCGDQQGSGTHDSNGIEVTCRQLVQWTELFKYDYCADSTYGPAIRGRCQGLCCTCSPAMEWLASWDYTNSSAGGMRGMETGPQPLIELTDDVNEARRLVSELAENVDTIAGELPRLGALVVGGSKAAKLQRPGARNPSLAAKESAQEKVDAENEFKDQWGAGSMPPPEAGEPSAAEGPRWVASPRVWSGTAQSEADVHADLPPPERNEEDMVPAGHDDATWVDPASPQLAGVNQTIQDDASDSPIHSITPYEAGGVKDLEGVDDSNRLIPDSTLPGQSVKGAAKVEDASPSTANALYGRLGRDGE